MNPFKFMLWAVGILGFAVTVLAAVIIILHSHKGGVIP